MINYLEKITKIIYREHKKGLSFKGEDHLTEEDLVCFLEDKLHGQDKDIIQKHLVNCNICAEYLSIQLKIKPHLSLEVPKQLLENVEKLLGQGIGGNLLEIFIKLKEKAMEIIQTTGDVLVGQELVPAPVLRSRKIDEFKEEVTILKDLQKIRVLAKIQNKGTKSFNLTITVKDKQSQNVHKNLRVTLIKDGIELESYVTDSSGSSFFENILLGNYMVEVSRLDQREVVIDLQVKA
ncbi:MAG: hypothetical protein Q7S42_06445 [Candidatus Omnitrophota bacterium]|nr:hypothetical protein [Candidatus Omnitrophota bacterium]